jgi:hypothetical protein
MMSYSDAVMGLQLDALFSKFAVRRAIGAALAGTAVLVAPAMASADELAPQPTAAAPAMLSPVALSPVAGPVLTQMTVHELPPGCRVLTGAAHDQVLLCPAGVPFSATSTPPPAAAPPSPAQPGVVTREWYGYQTLLVDAAVLSTSLGIGLQSRGGTSFAVVATTGYLAGGPLVHLLNGNPVAAAASLGVRVGAPVVGGLLGAAAGGSKSMAPYTAVLGSAIGVVSAIVFDSAYIANNTVKRPEVSATNTAFTIRPTANVTAKSTEAGVVGTF